MRNRASRDPRVEATTPVWLPAVVWLAYGVGAVLAGAAYRWWAPLALALDIDGDLRWPSAALVVPIGIVAIVALIVVGRWRRRRGTD